MGASRARPTRSVTHGYLRRLLHNEFKEEVVARHPTADGTFLNVYSLDYAAGQIMRIRRLADRSDDPRPDSLWWIIERIRKNPEVASRAALLDHVRTERPDANDAFWASDADDWYTRTFGADADVPTDGTLLAWQRVLREDLAAVIDFADRDLAHLDPQGPTITVTYAEIHEALDHCAQIANEIQLLLEYGTTAFELVTVMADWQEIFRPGLFPAEPEVRDHPGTDGVI